MVRTIARRAGPWIAVFSVLWLLGGSASVRADDAEEAASEEDAAAPPAEEQE